MATKNGLDKPEYSLQELLEVVQGIIHSKGLDTNPTCPQDSFKIVDEIRNMIWSHFTENPAENVDPGPIEELLHTGMTEDISVSHNEGEHSQVEHIRDYMKCSLPNCGFCHIMSDSAAALCPPGIHQAGAISPRHESGSC